MSRIEDLQAERETVRDEAVAFVAAGELDKARERLDRMDAIDAATLEAQGESLTGDGTQRPSAR